MYLLNVKRKGHGIDEWIRRETPNSRGLQLVKTHSLLYNKYHYVSHNDCGLISCSDTNISNPSKSSINITIKSSDQKCQLLSQISAVISITLSRIFINRSTGPKIILTYFY